MSQSTKRFPILLITVLVLATLGTICAFLSIEMSLTDSSLKMVLGKTPDISGSIQAQPTRDVFSSLQNGKDMDFDVLKRDTSITIIQLSKGSQICFIATVSSYQSSSETKHICIKSEDKKPKLMESYLNDNNSDYFSVFRILGVDYDIILTANFASLDFMNVNETNP